MGKEEEAGKSKEGHGLQLEERCAVNRPPPDATPRRRNRDTKGVARQQTSRREYYGAFSGQLALLFIMCYDLYSFMFTYWYFPEVSSLIYLHWRSGTSGFIYFIEQELPYFKS